MTRTHYAIRSKARNPMGGVNDSWIVTADFIAKANTDDSPYLIANEYIAASLAQYLCLPVPPFGLMREPGRHKGHKMMFASLRFTRTDTMPDDFQADICYRTMPSLCTGVLLFDVLIANADRHVYNIQCDDLSNPKKIQIFDHDHALFGVFSGKGVSRLSSLEDRLGMSGGSVTHGSRHCLMRHVDSTDHFGVWLDRIESIPDWYIREVCEAVRTLPCRKNEVDAVSRFLIARKQRLWQIVRNSRAEFEGIASSAWGLWI